MRSASVETETATHFAPRVRVSHRSFGAGVVQSVDGDKLEIKFAKVGVKAFAVEGMNEGRWVLLDFVDFVVHVFHPSMRTYYQLERLWGDAPALAVSP